MASADQRRLLLAIACPWCGAAPGEACTAQTSRKGRTALRISTLGAGCHDARWRKAVGQSAPVIAEVVAEIAGRDHNGNPRAHRASQLTKDKPTAPVGTAVLERPW